MTAIPDFRVCWRNSELLYCKSKYFCLSFAVPNSFEKINAGISVKWARVLIIFAQPFLLFFIIFSSYCITEIGININWHCIRVFLKMLFCVLPEFLNVLKSQGVGRIESSKCNSNKNIYFPRIRSRNAASLPNITGDTKMFLRTRMIRKCSSQPRSQPSAKSRYH